jgi:hypothetical protein
MKARHPSELVDKMAPADVFVEIETNAVSFKGQSGTHVL